MMEEKATSKKLSKAVLELKFMKKSKEKALVQEENEERQQLYQDQLSSLHEGAEKIVMVNSYVDCLKFLPCRLSFGGMDPDIEKLNEDKPMGLYTVVKPPPKEVLTQMDADVSAKEMVAHYRPTAHRPMPGHHIVKEEEEEEEEEKVQVEEPSHDPTLKCPQDHRKSKSYKMRPIYRDSIEGGGGGGGGGGGDGWARGNFRRGRGGSFKKGGKRGRGSKNGGKGSFSGGRSGEFPEGRGQDTNIKEEGFRGGKRGSFRGYLGGTGSRGHGRGDKRSHEANRDYHQDSDGHGHKKMKAERD